MAWGREVHTGVDFDRQWLIWEIQNLGLGGMPSGFATMVKFERIGEGLNIGDTLAFIERRVLWYLIQWERKITSYRRVSDWFFIPTMV